MWGSVIRFSIVTRRRRRPDEGFTLVEMMIAITLAAFVFLALASLMFATLRTVSLQKARSRGNEVATQGIEELQRLAYDRLGVCAVAGTPPSTFADIVQLPNCGSPDRFDPCVDPTGDTPDESYSCTVGEITYDVRRYVSFGDAARTEKRMAVFVTWTDQAGVHEVSEQSSVRIPTVASVIGLSPPALSNVSAVVQGFSPSTSSSIDAAGNLTSGPLELSATLTNPTPSASAANPDTVVASFLGRATDGTPEVKTFALSFVSETLYRGVIGTNQISWPTGKQHFTFSVVRRADGKANSVIDTDANHFCPTTSSASCPATQPTLTGGLQGGSTAIDIDATGALVDKVDVTATTTNVAPSDIVTVTLETLSGAVTLSLSPDPANFTCVPGSCAGVWRGVISPSSGYMFAAGTRPIFFSAVQIAGNPIAVGSTTASPSSNITFS